MKVLSIGKASYEISTLLEGFVQEGSTNDVVESLEAGGGTASNVACLLSKWGVESHFAGVVGSDAHGDKIKKEFEMSGVCTKTLETNFDLETPLTVNIVNKANGSRTSMDIFNPEKRLHLKNIDFGSEFDMFVLDADEYQASANMVFKYPDVPSVLDASKYCAEVLELAKFSKYIIASQEFVEKLTGIKLDVNNTNTLISAYSTLKGRYSLATIIIILNNNCVLYSVENEIKAMPAVVVDAKDATASSDMFVGGFVYSIANAFDVEKSITMALITLAFSTQTYGGRASIPNLNNVVAYYTEKKGVQSNVPTSTSAA